MHLLETMTGAKVETRLVLFAWISVFGMEPIPDDRSRIASALHVTRGQLKVAIDYLLEESYLLKKRKYFGLNSNGKKVFRYTYTLRPECWKLWPKVLYNTRFEDIFKDVIIGHVRHGNAVVTKPKPLSAAERLTLAIILTHANSALYVIRFDRISNSELLGISVLRLARLIRNLVKKGYLSTYSHLTTPKSKLSSLGMIYKIDVVTPNHKNINVGLPLIEGVESVASLAGLMRYYNNAVKRRKPEVYPPQPVLRSDENYFKLSKIFHNNKLFVFMYHLCQSIIFSEVSDYLNSLMAVRESERENAFRRQSDEVERTVRVKLSEVILCDEGESHEVHADGLEHAEPDSIEALVLLKGFLVEKLSMELSSTVINLVRQLTLLMDIYRVPFRVLAYQQKTVMTLLLRPPAVGNKEVETQIDSTIFSCFQSDMPDNQKVRPTAPIVLTLMVPNLTYFNDCLVAKDELFTEQSMLNDPRVKVAYEVKLHQPNQAKRIKAIASVSDNAGR